MPYYRLILAIHLVACKSTNTFSVLHINNSTIRKIFNEENDCVSHSLQDPSHKKVALTFHVCRVKLMVL